MQCNIINISKWDKNWRVLPDLHFETDDKLKMHFNVLKRVQ